MEQMSEEERQLRDDVDREVFGGELPVEEVEVIEKQQETVVEDPWAGVNPALRQSLESLQARMGDLDTLNTRVKEVTGRVGTLQSWQQTQERAAKSAPTPEQKAKADEESAQWDALKDAEPEIAGALERVKADLAGKTAELQGKLPDIDGLKAEFGKTLEERVETVRREMAIEATMAVHEDLPQIKVDPKFHEWVKAQPPETVAKLNSWRPIDAIKVLNAYKDHLKTQKDPQKIIESRNKRLASAAADNRQSGKPIKTKAEVDMTNAEYAAMVDRELWPKEGT